MTAVDRADLCGPEAESVLDGNCAALIPMLRRYVHRRVPADDVDDVLQAVLVELWRCRDRYDPRRSLEAWALAIARRRSIDHLRAQRRVMMPIEEAALAAGQDGRDLASRVDEAYDVREALDRLPAPQREAIEMAYFADLSQREIAECLDVPIGTIKARTARGMRRLRSLLA